MSLVVPDYPEPFLAYRSWRPRTVGNTVQLQGAYLAIPWPTSKSGGLAAQCHLSAPGFNWIQRLYDRVSPPHPCATSPGKRCRSHHPCGIYAYRTLDDLKRASISGPVWGEVLIGGDVWEHDFGYRAQFGTVHAIYDHIPRHKRDNAEEWLEQLGRIADHYSVPVVHMEA